MQGWIYVMIGAGGTLQYSRNLTTTCKGETCEVKVYYVISGIIIEKPFNFKTVKYWQNMTKNHIIADVFQKSQISMPSCVNQCFLWKKYANDQVYFSSSEK